MSLVFMGLLLVGALSMAFTSSGDSSESSSEVDDTETDPYPEPEQPEDEPWDGTVGDDDLEASGEGDIVLAGHGEDVLNDVGFNNVELYGGNDDDRIFSTGDDALLHGGAGGDSLYLREGDNSSAYGNQGDDYLSIRDGDGNLIHGGVGDDSLSVRGSNSIAIGGDGEDFVDVRDAALVFVDGGDGNDLIHTSVYGDGVSGTYEGGAGDDNIRGGENIISRGGDGNDSLSGGGTMEGGAGEDILVAGENAHFDGGSGDDTLLASLDLTTDPIEGGGVMTGGAGADEFRIAVEASGEVSATEPLYTIADFDPQEDLLGFGNSGIDGVDGAFDLELMPNTSEEYTDIRLLDPNSGAHQGTVRVLGYTNTTVDDIYRFDATGYSAQQGQFAPMGEVQTGTDGGDDLSVTTPQWLETRDGADTVTVGALSGGATVDLGAGNDVLRGDAVPVFVDPGEGDDTVHIGIGGNVQASEGADVIHLDLNNIAESDPVTAFEFSDEDDQLVIDLPDTGGPVVQISIGESGGGGSQYNEYMTTYIVQLPDDFEGEVTSELAYAIGTDAFYGQATDGTEPVYKVLVELDLGSEYGRLNDDDGSYDVSGELNRNPDISYVGEIAGAYSFS